MNIKDFQNRKKRLILASASPRRKELLKQIGVDFDTIPSRIEEKYQDGENPVQYALRLSEEKAREIVGHFQHAWIVGADTIVLLDGEILGKPDGEPEALAMLKKLSGREHRVITAFYVIDADTGKFAKEYVETAVVFRELTEKEVRAYVKTQEPLDKAGGYAIQGKGAFMVKEIKGSYTNVIGLPLYELMEAFKRLGY